jgi:hypothetical protein
MDHLALQSHFAVSADFVSAMGINKLLQFTNQTWNNRVDNNNQNILGRPFIFFVHPDDRDSTTRELDQLCGGKKTATSFEFRLLTSGDDWIWLTCSATISDGTILVIGRDCSAIKEKEALLEAVQKQTKTGGWKLDVSSMVTFWTDETYSIHEVAIGTPTNTSKGINFYHPDDKDQITQCVTLAINEGTPWNKTLRIVTAKNNQKWVIATGFAIRNQYGKVQASA